MRCVLRPLRASPNCKARRQDCPDEARNFRCALRHCRTVSSLTRKGDEERVDLAGPVDPDAPRGGPNLLHPRTRRDPGRGDHRHHGLPRWGLPDIRGLLLPRHVLRPLRIPDHVAAHFRMAAIGHRSTRSLLGSTGRRLLPALLVVLLGVSLFAAFVVSAGTYPTLRGDAISALFYYANWHFIAVGSNYFNQTALTSPLTHTWSLAVEEQFYLVWPLIVLGLFKLWRSTRALLIVCVVGALASSIEMAMLYSPGDVNRVYYGTDTRAQSLLVGAALAVSLSMWADHRHRTGTLPAGSDRERRRLGGDPAWAMQTARGRVAALVIGVAGVAASAVLWTVVSYNEAFAYRGGFLLAALATTAVLFSVVCSQRSVLARCLSFAPLRYVGRISYGMYLWHFPLFIYVDHARTGLTGYPLFAARLAATLLVATASFYVVERPIRQGHLFAAGGRGPSRRRPCWPPSSLSSWRRLPPR